mmetsp:Transcript_9370/g.21127  ORF Transcript_9370/g.21127 Transcript_9370/m.21127 type:complete len:80 (+) Transcript_9370:451-690(+)
MCSPHNMWEYELHLFQIHKVVDSFRFTMIHFHSRFILMSQQQHNHDEKRDCALHYRAGAATPSKVTIKTFFVAAVRLPV